MKNDELDRLLDMVDYSPFYLFRDIYMRMTELINS